MPRTLETKVHQTSFRLDHETWKLMNELTARLKIGRVQVLRLAIRALAKRESMTGARW